MNKKLFLIPLALLLALSLIAIGCPTPQPTTPTTPTTPTPTTPMSTAPPEVIKARYSGWAPPPSIPGQVEVHFFDLLNEKVGDLIQVEVFQGNTLYNYQEVLLPLKTGAVEMVNFCTIQLNEWVRDFQVTTLTGAWDADELMAYMDSPEFKPAWDKMLETSNSIPLAPHMSGTFYIFSTRPLISTADFKDLRVQCSNFGQIDVVKALGGSGGSLAVTDIYTALQQGMYDASIGTPSIALGFGWPEFTKYVSKEAWFNNICFILVNKDFWDSLPKDVQDAFKETAEETSEWSLTFAPQAEQQQLAMLEEKWDIEYFTIDDWEKVIETAQTQVWPETRVEVGAEFFDTALQYAGLAEK